MAKERKATVQDFYMPCSEWGRSLMYLPVLHVIVELNTAGAGDFEEANRMGVNQFAVEAGASSILVKRNGCGVHNSFWWLWLMVSGCSGLKDRNLDLGWAWEAF